jgi:hypothetical protein
LALQADAGSQQLAGIMRAARPQAFAAETNENNEAAGLERSV